MDFQGRSLKAQMSLADRLGAIYVIILGDREMETGQALLRRMATGGQEQVALNELPAMLANFISGKV
jgi:histidyl-tRNA synthetase